MRVTHNIGDPVRRPDDKAVGNVVEKHPQNYVVVKWPNGTFSKHHAGYLLGMGQEAKQS